jgi:hypothetical protein
MSVWQTPFKHKYVSLSNSLQFDRLTYLCLKGVRQTDIFVFEGSSTDWHICDWREFDRLTYLRLKYVSLSYFLQTQICQSVELPSITNMSVCRTPFKHKYVNQINLQPYYQKQEGIGVKMVTKWGKQQWKEIIGDFLSYICICNIKQTSLTLIVLIF